MKLFFVVYRAFSWRQENGSFGMNQRITPQPLQKQIQQLNSLQV